MLTPQNQAKQIILVIPFQWFQSFGMAIFSIVNNWVFVQKQRKKEHSLGTVKLHCLSSDKNFFLKFIGPGIIPGYSEMMGPSTFR